MEETRSLEHEFIQTEANARSTPAAQERLLLCAILEQAQRTLIRSSPGKVAYEEALTWFSSDSRDHLTTFQNICDILSISASTLRARTYFLISQGGRASCNSTDAAGQASRSLSPRSRFTGNGKCRIIQHSTRDRKSHGARYTTNSR